MRANHACAGSVAASTDLILVDFVPRSRQQASRFRFNLMNYLVCVRNLGQRWRRTS